MSRVLTLEDLSDLGLKTHFYLDLYELQLGPITLQNVGE